MRRLYVRVSEETFDSLAKRAARERRDVRDEAALLIERTLERDVSRGRLDDVQGAGPRALEAPAHD
jgi:hypothetical protein